MTEKHSDRVEQLLTSGRREWETECPFCRRIKAGEFDSINHDEIVWFEPLNPVTSGHMLFLPATHVEHPEEVAGPIAVANAMRAAAEWGIRGGEEFNLITSYGSAATQTVPHIHAHYVPRRAGDGLTLPWTGQKRTTEKGSNA